MEFAKYTFACSTPEGYVPENPLGLRDTLMESLRTVACSSPGEDCDTCKRGWIACPYLRVYMSPIDWNISKTFFLKKKIYHGFSFDLRLFSYAVDKASRYISSLIETLKPYSLDSIKGLFSSVAVLKGEVLYGLSSASIDLPRWKPFDRWDGTLKVSFHTPCHIKRGRKNPKLELSFTEFMALVLDCDNYVWGLEGETVSRFFPEEFVQSTNLIEIKEDHLNWVEEGKDRSSEQKFYAVSGEIIYKGEISPYLSLISFAEQIQGRRIKAVRIGEFSSHMDYTVRRIYTLNDSAWL